MKKGIDDVKSYVTILFATALVALLFIAVFKGTTFIYYTILRNNHKKLP